MDKVERHSSLNPLDRRVWFSSPSQVELTLAALFVLTPSIEAVSYTHLTLPTIYSV